MIEGITGKKVAKQVRKIAEERPDFVYTDQSVEVSDVEDCSYFGRSVYDPDVGQGCIVGQALKDLGVTKEEMIKADIENHFASSALKRLGIFSMEEYDKFLDTVQYNQDAGLSWGMAIERTKEFGH